MVTKRNKPREQTSSPVHSNGAPSQDGTRRLPPEFDRLAAGEHGPPPAPPPRGGAGRVRDPRDRVLIPGANNRDCRAVYDARLSTLRQAAAEGDMEAVGRGLLEFSQLSLFRARNVVSLDAFATSVLELAPEQIEPLLEAAARRVGIGPQALPEAVTALWIRCEAALRVHHPEAAVRLVKHGAETRLTFSVPSDPVGRAVDALSAVGRQAAGLGRHLETAPATRPRQGRDRKPTLPERPSLLFRRRER